MHESNQNNNNWTSLGPSLRSGRDLEKKIKSKQKILCQREEMVTCVVHEPLTEPSQNVIIENTFSTIIGTSKLLEKRKPNRKESNLYNLQNSNWFSFQFRSN